MEQEKFTNLMKHITATLCIYIRGRALHYVRQLRLFVLEQTNRCLNKHPNTP